MVLTHFECWAHGGSAENTVLSSDSIERRSNKVDPFNPVMICPNVINSERLIEQNNVSHLSSNGYYGFAQVSDVNNEYTASPAVNGTSTVLETSCCMDVEPQYNTNGGRNSQRGNFSNDIDTCCDRRKRGYTNEYENEINRHSKRFCSRNEHELTTTENEYLQLEPSNVICSMDQEDIPVQNIDNQNTAMGYNSGAPFHSNTHQNYKYNDISRCITSHMV